MEVPHRLTMADLPDELGSWKGAYSRFRCWTLDGTWQKVLTAVLGRR